VAEPERAYSTRQVEKAFRAEGLDLRRLRRRFRLDEGITFLTATNLDDFGDFGVAVYPKSQATAQLGLRLQPSSHDEMERLRNVVVSFASASKSAPQVRAALSRLRGS
jgi:hypothetical protein